MKRIKHITLLAILLVTAVSCMNEFETPEFATPPFGNNEIGEANTTIAELKSMFSKAIEGNGYQEVKDEIIIEGVVVANDESGNVYKQFVINDTTGAIIIGVNDVGLYATMAIGQRVRIDCKGLYVGGYGKLAQVGGLYNGSIGRMNKSLFPKHIRIIGIPDRTQPEMTPEVIDETFFTSENIKTLAKYVRLENVKIEEAIDNTVKWAPEELANSSNVVERNIKMGKKNIVLRMSTYADFANDTLPTGNLNINGVLTRYNNYWQFMISSTADIEKIENNN